MTVNSDWVYLFTIAITWVVAHSIKSVIALKQHQRKHWYDHFFDSGGMPSAHTATTVAITALIGLRLGVGNALFALAVLFTIITMHDAMRVRWSTGENSRLIGQLIKEQGSKLIPPRIYRGHTRKEVIYGALLGLAISIVVFLATKLS